MGLLSSVSSYGKTAAGLILFLLPAVGLAQQNTANNSAASQIFQKADSLRYISHFDSSNTLFQKAANLFEQEQHWLKKAEALYKISQNKTEQNLLDKASYYLDKGYSLFQTKKLRDPGFEIKYHYQKGIIAIQRADYKSALDWSEKGLELAHSNNEQELLTAKLLVNIGAIYIAQGSYQKAIEQFSEAEDLYHHRGVQNKRLLSRIYNSYGRAYQNNGDLKRALQYFRKSLEVDRQTLLSPHPNLAQTNNNIAISYYYRGDYQRALDYFINAVTVLAEFHGENHRLVAAGYNNVGIVYSEIGELERATGYLEKALRIKEKVLGKDHPDIAIGYQNLGAIYYDMEKYDQAIGYYKKSEELLLDRFPDGHPELANVYANLGEAYTAKEAYEKALDYYYKDLNINMEQLDNNHPFIGDTFTKIGRTYAMIKNYDTALIYYRRALKVFVPDYTQEGRYQNPPFEQLAYPYLLLETLKLKGNTLQKYAEQSGRQKLLDQSLQTYLQGVELIDNLQRSYNREESKFVLRERSVEVYKKGFKTAYTLHQKTGDPEYKEYAFYFAEKSRNQILLEQVQKLNARKLANLPDSLVHKEQHLQSRLTDLQAQISDLAVTPQKSDSLQRVTLQDSLFHVRKMLEQHVQHLESSYPKYYELKYEPVVTRVEEIQQDLLSPEQTMVSYFFGEESLFALVISRNSFEIRDLGTDFVSQQDIRNYRNAILETSSATAFAKSSNHLYNKLINPISDLISDKDLLIIPDGMLHYLPFGSLVTNTVANSNTAQFQNLHYLIQDHIVSYAPSAGYLHLSSQESNPKPNKQLAGFAPGFSELSSSEKRVLYPDYKRSLSSLPFSKKEVEELGDLFNSNSGFWSFLTSSSEQADMYVGDAASEDIFKNLPLENYRYIHLATHAYVSEEQPEQSGILFAAPQDSGEDGTLHAAEIYNLQLNAHLVTLSACETGIGTIAEGEGMMSLSRAFQYAGAQNLLVSLWQVSDRSTARLMVDFYKLNQQDFIMPAALREAKITMINEGQYSHPKYWALFIFIGQ
jgi:CHAT domain-containing protein/Tfp pilus assembly protein PilF